MPPNPYSFPDLEVSEAAAVIAVAKGEATADQQILAFRTIAEKISNMHGFHFYPSSARDTDFALGKAQVGQLMVGIVKSGTEPFRQQALKKTPPHQKRGNK
ncbi:MAG: hypothetical protein RL651_1785 [Pseudomonadota bacterium]|jgi:hypothetical protein